MDTDKQLTVLTDRSQGGSGIKDGQVELMIHRRTQVDDMRGVREPLNETGQFTLRFADQTLQGSVLSSHTCRGTIYGAIFHAVNWGSGLGSEFNTTQSLLTSPLPANVHLLTLEKWSDDKIVLRLEHQFEANEDKGYSKPVTFSLKGLFVTFDIQSVEERTLAANKELTKNKRLKWSVTDSAEPTPPDFKPIPVPPDTLEVTLNPMQIRTFIATIQWKTDTVWRKFV